MEKMNLVDDCFEAEALLARSLKGGYFLAHVLCDVTML